MTRLWRRLTTISTAAVLSIGLITLSPSQAMDFAEKERLTYAAMLGGLHVADLMVTLDQNEVGYRSDLEVISRGVVRWVQDFRARITGEGAFAPTELENGSEILLLQPDRFHREWTGGEVSSLMTMTFDPETGEAVVAERLYNPLTDEDLSPEDMPWNRDERREEREPVPEDLRRDVLDPMGAFIAARRQILAQGGASGASKSFRVPIYDGQRRYDIVGKTAPIRSTEINGTEMAVIPVSVKLEPVFGFNERSKNRMTDTTSRLYFSADGRFIPIQFMMASDLFAVVINLDADCNVNAAPCDTFGQEPTP
jgi:hypothetical protein